MIWTHVARYLASGLASLALAQSISSMAIADIWRSHPHLPIASKADITENSTASSNISSKKSVLFISTANQKLSHIQRKQTSGDLPLPPRNPTSSSAGGRRDGTTCLQDAATSTGEPSLTALSPTLKPGLTLSPHPTFLIYVPPTSAQTAEFSLRTSQDQGVYRTTILLNHTPSIVSISLPADSPPLAIGSTYTWSFNLICNPNDRIEDLFSVGSIQRIQSNPIQTQSLDQLSPAELVSLYHASGIWYDVLAALFKLQQTNPGDPAINQSWSDLLHIGGFGAIAPLSVTPH
ncbi:MAG TPA: DUF928 domain-containing protein [Crinalium sp.]|jgi:hypothetical protein